MKNWAVHVDTELRWFEREDEALSNAASEILIWREESLVDGIWDGWSDVVDGVTVLQVVHRAMPVDPEAPYQVMDYVMKQTLTGETEVSKPVTDYLDALNTVGVDELSAEIQKIDSMMAKLQRKRTALRLALELIADGPVTEIDDHCRSALQMIAEKHIPAAEGNEAIVVQGYCYEVQTIAESALGDYSAPTPRELTSHKVSDLVKLGQSRIPCVNGRAHCFPAVKKRADVDDDPACVWCGHYKSDCVMIADAEPAAKPAEPAERDWRDQVCRQCGVRCGNSKQKYCGDGLNKDNPHEWYFPEPGEPLPVPTPPSLKLSTRGRPRKADVTGLKPIADVPAVPAVKPTTPPVKESDRPLIDRIIVHLRASGPMKAKDIATSLGVHLRQVTDCIHDRRNESSFVATGVPGFRTYSLK